MRFLLALLILAVLVGGVAVAAPPPPGAPTREEPGHGGLLPSEEHAEEHAHSEGASSAQAVEDSGHLPVQVYTVREYFQAPYRDPRSPSRLAIQTGVVAALDALLLVWLWRRWWRR